MSFASFRLDTLNLPPTYITVCTRANLFTASDVLLLAPADLARRLRNANSNLSAPALVKDVARAIVPQSRLVTQREDPILIRTGDKHVDALLGGGVRTGCITELVGESAAGKSHMTLLLSLAAQNPSLCDIPGGVIMLNSERVLETKRLVELARVMRARHGGPPTLDIMDNIHTNRCTDVEALEHALQFVLPHMLAERKDTTGSALMGDVEVPLTNPVQQGRRGYKPIRLLVLDSLTALLRGDTEHSSGGLIQRSKHLCFISDRLKALAVEYRIAVVVVNQVSDVFGPDRGSGQGSQGRGLDGRELPPPPPMLYANQAQHFGQMPDIRKEASLGIVWANAVNTRLMMARTGRRRMLTVDDLLRPPKRQRTSSSNRAHAADEQRDPDAPLPPGLEVDESKPALVRKMCIVFSPFAPSGTLDYILTGSGLHALPGSFRAVDLGRAIRRRDARVRTEYENRVAAARRQRVADTQVAPPAATQAESDEEDVFDDFGDLPPEFWEGIDKLDEEPMAVGVVD